MRSAAFSPDGQRLATAADDGTARLWDARQPAPRSARPCGHEGRYRSAAFSPDGTRLATASDDGTARLWDAASGAPLGPLRGHEGGIDAPPSARTGGGWPRAVWAGRCIWIARAETLAEMVCAKVRRNLTRDEWRQFVGADLPYQRTCPNLPSGDGAPPEVPAPRSPP